MLFLVYCKSVRQTCLSLWPSGLSGPNPSGVLALIRLALWPAQTDVHTQKFTITIYTFKRSDTKTQIQIFLENTGTHNRIHAAHRYTHINTHS